MQRARMIAGSLGQWARLYSAASRPRVCRETTTLPAQHRRRGRRAGLLSLCCSGCLAGLPACAATVGSARPSRAFYRLGARLWRGACGAALLEPRPWRAGGECRTFLASSGAAQAVPGPLSLLLPTRRSRDISPTDYADAALAAIFMPGFLLYGGLPFWDSSARCERKHDARRQCRSGRFWQHPLRFGWTDPF